MKMIPLFTLLVLVFSCTEATDNGKRSRNNGAREDQTTERPPASIPFHNSMPSHISRNRGAKQLTYQEVNEMFRDNSISSSLIYRAVPIEGLDNTGQIVEAGRPTVACGLNPDFSGIRASINDCTTKNNGRHIWVGKDFGIAGEGDWSLVAVSDSPEFTIWMDQRTERLWSHAVARADWIDASGNNQANSPCGDLKVFPEDQVAWRLPTRNEFLQADINGYPSIFKLEDLKEEIFWTATSASNIDNAWVIKISNGVLSEVDKDTNTVAVKCVGQILK